MFLRYCLAMKSLDQQLDIHVQKVWFSGMRPSFEIAKAKRRQYGSMSIEQQKGPDQVCSRISVLCP